MKNNITHTLLKLLEQKKITQDEFQELMRLFILISEQMKKTDLRKIEDIENKIKSLEDLETINKTLDEISKAKHKPTKYYHSEDLLSKFSIFKKYPYVVQDTFFNHPNEEDVTYKSGRYSLTEKMVVALYDMLPGSFSVRTGLPIKVKTNGLTQLIGGIYATKDLKHTIDCEIVGQIPKENIPEDFPKDVIKLPPGENTLNVFKPKTMQYTSLIYCNWWYKNAPGVLVCPSCGLVPDGDELNDYEPFCPSCSKTILVHNRTVPSSFAKSWYYISAEKDLNEISQIKYELPEGKIEPSIQTESPFLTRTLFNKILFSQKIDVLHYYYCLQRSYNRKDIQSNPLSIFFIYNNRPIALGTQLITDGLVFRYNDKLISDFSNDILESNQMLAEIKEIIVQFLFHITRKSLKNDLGYFEYNRVFKVIISNLLEKNSYVLPLDLTKVKECTLNLINNKTRLKELLEVQNPKITDERLGVIIKKIEENKEFFNQIDSHNLKSFISTVIVHSLAHGLLESLNKISGAPEHSSGYFFDENKKEIYLFDSVSGGNGICEAVKNYFYIPFAFRNALIRQRLGRFETTPTFLPTRDFVTYFEEFFEACPDYTSARILFELSKKVDLQLLWEIWEKPEKRSEYVAKIIENNSLLLGNQGSFFEFNLRNGTCIIFKYIQQIIGISNYNDLAALQINPEVIYNVLESEISADCLNKLLRHNKKERRIQELEEIISLCYSSCPTCSLPSKCTYGFFEPEHYVNHRVMRMFYEHIINEVAINYIPDTEDPFSSKVKKSLTEKKVAYIKIKYPSNGIDAISPFIGLRDGKEFRVIVENGTDVIYATTNYKFNQVKPLFDEINSSLDIPQIMIVKLELS